MRITQTMLSNTMMRNLNQSLERMDRIQDSLATGKKISKPSQDPVVAVQGMFYRSTLMENEQFRRNTDSAVNWLDATESALSEGGNVLSRVKELMTQASSDTISQGDREKIREELIQLRDHLGNVANTNAGGLYLFGGTDTLTPPFEQKVSNNFPQGANANEIPYAPIIGYRNNNSANIEMELSQAIYLPINVDGVQLFGQQKSDALPTAPLVNPTTPEEIELQKKYDEAWKTDLFGAMDKIINDLKPSPYATDNQGHLLAVDKDGNPLFKLEKVKTDPNDPTKQVEVKVAVLYDPKNAEHSILRKPAEEAKPKTGNELTNHLGVIEKHIDNFLQVQAAIGARMNRLELIQQRLDDQHQSTENVMSKGEDADMAQVITNLQNEENVHRAALASGSRIIQPTLLDFLR